MRAVRLPAGGMPHRRGSLPGAFQGRFGREQNHGLRAISRLCQAGRLRRYAPHESGEAARYQHNPCTESHLHIRCIHCGALAHLHCDEAEAFARHLGQHHGFTLDERQTILYGVCQACREKNAK